MSPPTLPELLVRLGYITKDQMNNVIDKITMSTEEDRIAMMFVALDLVTNKQLEEARELLKKMNSTNRVERAEAAHDFSQKRVATITSLACRLRARAGTVRGMTDEARKVTGEQAAIPMLAKPTDS